ncbi:MAG: divalent-cation tolerance protein CutA [Parvularcula sp.]|jgi:periplasmic divalent cation tolerance protein|nr:divalent-cation tolerance protein CutA [Parvularcula sp.]
MSLMLVITTVSSREDAVALARHLVQEKLGACVQLFPCESLYTWEGDVVLDQEYRVEIKTTETAAPGVMKILAAKHPYDEPEIIALPVSLASEGYRRFVETGTKR